EHGEAARLRLRPHRLRHAVRAEHDGCAAGNFVELLDEHRALALQIIDDEAVMHDLVAHVDRRAELRERLLDDCDCPIDAGAESARIGEKNLHHESFAGSAAGSSRRWRKLSRISAAAPTVIALSATL